MSKLTKAEAVALYNEIAKINTPNGYFEEWNF